MKLVFPATVLTQHIVALGKTGSGKSSVIRYILEEVVGTTGRANPACILDPKGDWWGLKFSGSGKGPGVEVVIFGGPHADIPITPDAGAAVGEIVATSAFTCIVDVSEFTMGERTRFAVAFLGTLFRKTKGQRFLVIDECHNFVPQGKVLDPLSGQMLHWGNRFASEGRGKGVTLIAASQRPQKVHKDFLTSMETLIAMRVIHKLDRKALADWLEGAPDQEAAKQVLADVANLKRGTGWMWSPEIGFGPKLIEFPRFHTYDSFKPQSEDVQLKGAATSEELDRLRELFAEQIREAEANDPAMLKKRIRDLEDQLERAGGEVDLDQLELAKSDAYERGLAAAWHEIGQRLIKVMPHLNSIENARIQLQDRIEGSLKIELESLAEQLEGMEDIAREAPKVGDTVPPRVAKPPPGAKILTRTEFKALGQQICDDTNGELGLMNVRERKILTVLAQQGRPLTKAQILTFASYRSSGKVSSAFASLSRKGWMVEESTSLFSITTDGLKALGDFEPMPTGRRLREQLLNGSRLDVREKKLLSHLVDAYPNPMAKGRILELAGYQSSGKVSSAFSRLQKLGYARPAGVGKLVASKELF